MNRVARVIFYLSVMQSLVSVPGFCVAAGPAVPSPEQIVDIEKRIIESRKALKSGHVELSISYRDCSFAPEMVGVKKHYNLFFRGNNWRADSWSNKDPQPWKVVFTADTFIRASPTTRPVQLFGPTTRPKEQMEVPDPRRLGLVVWHFDTINQHGYEQYLLRPDRRDVRIVADTEAGESVWKVTYQVDVQHGTLSVEYWLAQNKGQLPIYISNWIGEGADRHVNSLSIKLQYLATSRMWYPKEVVLLAKRGDQIEVEEIDTVERASFGQQIPERTFSLSGLDLAPGRLVDNDGRIMAWTGSQLTPAFTGQEYLQQAPTPDSRWRRWILIGNAVFLILIAAIIVWRKRSLRAAQ